MSELDNVRSIAKQVLTLSTAWGGKDESLWDRAQRLVRNARHISSLPELAKSGRKIDSFCLTVATYFLDSGLAMRSREAKDGDFNPLEVDSQEVLHDSTDIVRRQLGGLLGEEKIEKINLIILESSGNFTQMSEAMILSDARNLDDMGAAGLFNEAKRYAMNGKSISDALQIWQRKIDYRYWQARLKDSFRFESVRKIAARRLTAAEYFMSQLNAENGARDLEEFSAGGVVV
jgi:hypothetical protein